MEVFIEYHWRLVGITGNLCHCIFYFEVCVCCYEIQYLPLPIIKLRMSIETEMIVF